MTPEETAIGPRAQRMIEEYARIGDPPTVRGMVRFWWAVIRLRLECNPTICTWRKHPLAGYEVTHPSFGTVQSCGCGQRLETVY